MALETEFYNQVDAVLMTFDLSHEDVASSLEQRGDEIDEPEHEEGAAEFIYRSVNAELNQYEDSKSDLYLIGTKKDEIDDRSSAKFENFK